MSTSKIFRRHFDKMTIFVWHYSWGEKKNMKEYLLTPEKELMTDQSTDTAIVQLGEPKSFVGIIVKGQKKLEDSCIAKTHLSMGDSSQNREPRAHCTTCGQLYSW